MITTTTRPPWLTEPCPTWCTGVPREDDLPGDRTHWDDVIPRAMTRQPGTELLVGLHQHVADAEVSVFIERDDQAGGFDFTAADARVLRDRLRCCSSRRSVPAPMTKRPRSPFGSGAPSCSGARRHTWAVRGVDGNSAATISRPVRIGNGRTDPDAAAGAGPPGRAVGPGTSVIARRTAPEAGRCRYAPTAGRHA